MSDERYVVKRSWPYETNPRRRRIGELVVTSHPKIGKRSVAHGDYHRLVLFRKDIVKIAHDVAGAASRRDGEGMHKALQAMGSAFDRATPAERQRALMVMLPLAETLPFGVGAPVAEGAGALAEMGTDPLVALPVLVERAASAMEAANVFREIYDQLGVEPFEDGLDAAIERLTREQERLGLTEDDVFRLTGAFHRGGDWVQPVLVLCQRKDVRLALPQRERLTRAIVPMVDHIETARWLYGLLRVLDDEPLVVLHRETGKGFRLRISGIGNNYQLDTLLAAHLIGEVPGKPLSAAEAAAATDGKIMPERGIYGRFNLVDASGKWISGTDGPSDIPMLDGVRVVVLDSPPYERGWTAGRNYPLMMPEVVVEERLSPQEAGDLLSQVAPAAATGGDDDGAMVLTDNLTLPLSGEGYDQLVDFIIRELLAGKDHEVLARELSVRFGLSFEDTEFALDRTFGGLVRARTRNLANCPPREQDPVAWESFQRGMDDPSIIERCLGR